MDGRGSVHLSIIYWHKPSFLRILSTYFPNSSSSFCYQIWNAWSSSQISYPRNHRHDEFRNKQLCCYAGEHGHCGWRR